jgi:nitrite reductase/ring-hydroxylating ferredoxin subunit
MPLVHVARVSEVPPESARECVVGDHVVAICHSAGAITAMDGRCMHAGGPLGEGLIAEGRVACPWHLWEFDCRTGEFDRNPAVRQQTYPVEVRGEDIFVDLPESGA